MTPLRPPFPDRVRRAAPRRRRRPTSLLPLALAAAAALAAPAWTVRGVRCPDRPPACLRRNLELIAGAPLLAADLGWIRRQVEAWPGIAAIEIRRELDGTLLVDWSPCEAAGSFRTGLGWHAVCADGTPGPRIGGPVAPVIEAPLDEPATVRRVLEATRRLEEAGLPAVTRVRLLLPGELELTARRGEETVRVLATVEPRRSERLLGRLAAAESVRFLDLTADDRIVIERNGEVTS